MKMEEKNIQLDFRNMPRSWQLCFLTECPMKDRCLRQLAARHIEERDFGPAVYPTMEIGDEGCRLFAECEPMLMAWGFETLFSEVKSKDEKMLRYSIKKYLGGHSTYYRYNNGERLLSAEQQEWVLGLFRRYGYTEHLEFDHYAYTYKYD